MYNYLRQMQAFIGKQFIYYGEIHDWDEFILYMILIPIFTIALRQVPRTFLVNTRYMWAYIMIERKILYGYDFINNRNDAEALYGNNAIASFLMFYIESCSMIVPFVIDGFIKRTMSIREALDYFWYHLKDYEYACLTLIIIQKYVIGAPIRISMPILPLEDILAHKVIYGW